MPTTKTITVPDGFTDVTMLFPTSRLQSAIDTFAESGGYSPTIHGSTPAAKADFAKKAMAAMLDQMMLARDAQIAVANATATNKVTAL